MASPRGPEPLLEALEPRNSSGVNGSEGCSLGSCGKRNVDWCLGMGLLASLTPVKAGEWR